MIQDSEIKSPVLTPYNFFVFCLQPFNG